MVTGSMVCDALAAGTLRPLLLAHRRRGCVRRVNQQTQRWADRESAQAQASGPRGFGGSMKSRATRVESSDSSGARVVEGAIETRTMAALEDWSRNRSKDAAIRGDLNSPETRGLNRRGGSERVVESGAAGLGAGGLARWPERDGVRRRTGGTVSRTQSDSAREGHRRGVDPGQGAACERRGSIGPGFEFEGVCVRRR